MKTLLAYLAAAAIALPAAAQTAPQLSLDHRMLLRCSAAFALVAYRQQANDPDYAQYPPLKERGGEFFVQASARVMDEAGLDRPAISAALENEARELVQGGTLAAVMPVCLTALEATER